MKCQFMTDKLRCRLYKASLKMEFDDTGRVPETCDHIGGQLVI